MMEDGTEQMLLPECFYDTLELAVRMLRDANIIREQKAVSSLKKRGYRSVLTQNDPIEDMEDEGRDVVGELDA